MPPPLLIEDVWKTFGSVCAVRGLNLNVPGGSVYGFLGPNGAGKSTTIRMVLGLQRPDRGKIRLFGESMETERRRLLGRVGSLVESPSLYLHLTGRENLEVHRLLLDLPKGSVAEALETVDLSAAANRLVREYSSGMKRRLGLAQAMLGNPEMLLLDEPTNALDPAGIHEVRNLIRDLPQRRGVTVFLSSHLLAEVEQVATHLAIVSQGEVRFAGRVEELLIRNRPSIALEVDRPEAARGVLEDAGLDVKVDGNRLRTPVGGVLNAAQVNALLVNAGIAVAALMTERPTLEDVFLALTGSEVR